MPTDPAYDPRGAPPDPTIACTTCRACCCRLEVILMGEDDVPARFAVTDRWGGQVMARLEDGLCAALDRDTYRCTIYARRPGVCRDFAVGGDDCKTERAGERAGFGHTIGVIR